MMKLTKVFALLLALAMLLCACTAAPQPTEAPTPVTEAGAATGPAVSETLPP